MDLIEDLFQQIAELNSTIYLLDRQSHPVSLETIKDMDPITLQERILCDVHVDKNERIHVIMQITCENVKKVLNELDPWITENNLYMRETFLDKPLKGALKS